MKNLSYLLAMLALMFSSANANALGAYQFSKNGVSYEIITTELCPMWVSVIPDESYRELKSISIPAEMEVEGYSMIRPLREAVVKEIAANAFWGCDNLKEITLPSTITAINNYAFASTDLLSISLPESLKYLGKFAFASCISLEEIIVPEGVRFIDLGCFKACQELNKVSLPSTLMELGGQTFRYCGSITDIYCSALIPPVAADNNFVSEGCDDVPELDMASGPDMETCILHVPAESVKLYEEAEGWCLFKNIVEITNDPVEVEDVMVETAPYSIENGILKATLHQGEEISLYDIDGHLITRHTATGCEEYSHNADGLVILRLNDRSYKIIL